jgi:hypothetical protein
MKLRRLVALLTSATMFHLSLAAGDSACATSEANGHHAANTSGRAVAEHVMPMEGHAMAMADVAEACETPSERHCCDVLAGCSVVGAVTSERQVLASTDLPAARIREALHDVPASFASAPEPPPPKA